MSEFKYLGYVLDESGTGIEYCRKVMFGRKVAGAIRPLFNALSLQLECVRVLHEELLLSVRFYGRERMIWREKEG